MLVVGEVLFTVVIRLNYNRKCVGKSGGAKGREDSLSHLVLPFPLRKSCHVLVGHNQRYIPFSFSPLLFGSGPSSKQDQKEMN